MASNDMGNPRVTQPASARPPKNTARIAGIDYRSVNDGDIDDSLRDDFVPGGVQQKNSPGGPYGSGR